MSIKENLTGEEFVPGNLKDFLQSYHIDYYPPEANYPTDKVWIYFDGRENGKPRMIRSLCFKNPENHKKFILNNIYAHIYQLVRRAEDHIPNHVEIFKYQMALLNDLLIKIREELPKRWKERLEEQYVKIQKRL